MLVPMRLVGVAVVEVGDVRVRMDHFGVVVLVGVPAGEPVGVLMTVVSVVVGVFVSLMPAQRAWHVHGSHSTKPQYDLSRSAPRGLVAPRG